MNSRWRKIRGRIKTLSFNEGMGLPGQLHSGTETVSAVGGGSSFTPNHMSPERPREATASNMVMARKKAWTNDCVLHVQSLAPTPPPSCSGGGKQNTQYSLHTDIHSMRIHKIMNVFPSSLWEGK